MVKDPKPETLAKYGLSVEEFRALCESQGSVCAVCGKLPKTGRLCIDHEHVVRWKHLKPEARKTYVRGLLCFFCNRYYVGRSITIQKARNVVRYLEEHERRLYGTVAT